MGRSHPLEEGAGEPGFRVFRVRVPSATREALAKLYRDATAGRARSKMLHYYLEEWENALREVLEARVRAGKRTPPRPPPPFLLVRFITLDGEERGNKNAPCVIDLRKRELRIPSYGIKIPLRPSLIRALIEENGLEPRSEFVLQLTSRGKLRLVAKRTPPLPQLSTPLRVIAINENSAHGFALAVIDFDDRGCRLALFEKLRPPNHGRRRQLAALLQGFADAPSEEKRAQLYQLLGQELVKALTPERARELARQTRKKERRLNDAFVRRFAARVRGLVREARSRGASVIVLADPIDSETLRGTGLQGTLLRARRALENLCRYEGALFVKLRASGRQCPLCGLWSVEIKRTMRSRIYKCWRCGAVWDRDKGALYNLTAEYFEKLRKHGNETAERALASLKQWLKKHPKALEY